MRSAVVPLLRPSQTMEPLARTPRRPPWEALSRILRGLVLTLAALLIPDAASRLMTVELTWWDVLGLGQQHVGLAQQDVRALRRSGSAVA